MITLNVVPAHGPPFEYRPEGEERVIGRSSKADLVIADRSLSRQHARLVYRDERWLIEDLGSRNGTHVNRMPISEATVLQDGDIIGLGASTVTVRQTGGLAAEPSLSDAFGEHTVFRPAAELLESSAVHQPPAAVADAETLKRYTQRLHMLNQVHQALGATVALDELLDLILDRAFEQLGPEEGAIFLRMDDGSYECAASRSHRGPDHRCLYSRALIREVAEKGLAALVLDAQIDERFNQAASILNAGVRSLVASPLQTPGGTLGMMVVGSTLSVRQFTEEDMELLTSLASVAAMRISNVRLAEEAVERKKLEHEVALAREIQVAALPDSLPEPEGYDLYGVNLPSRGVSGDFFKVVERGDGAECVFFLADVSGKGIGAAMLTTSVEALAAGPIEGGVSPDQACEQVSRRLFRRTPPEKYATAFMAVLEAASGVVRYTNAGHNSGLIIRDDGSTEWLESTGPPLGILEDGSYELKEAILRARDTLVLYTDGITEAESPDEEEYGEQRLETVCIRNRELPLGGLATALEVDLEAFANGVPYADDRTIVMVRRER
jgi:sigma-B regulation protein RsbU (phosphoserine phosphatase)